MFRFALLLSFSAVLPLRAAPTPPPFLEDTTVALLRIDLEQIDFQALGKVIESLHLPMSGPAFPPPELVKMVGVLKAEKVAQLTFVFTLADQPQKPPFAIATLAPGAEAAAAAGQLNETKLFGPQKWAVVKDQLVMGAEGTLQRLAEMKPVERPELLKAADFYGKSMVQFSLAIPPDSRKLLEESLPRLPDQVGGGSIKVVTRGMQWLALGLEAPPNFALRATIQTPDKDSAEELRTLWSKALKLAIGLPEVQDIAPKIADHVARLTPEVDGDRLKLNLDSNLLTSFLAQPVAKARIAAQRAASTNNLKQLVLAFHNVHSQNNAFPPTAITSKDGKPLLSWRVAILPYIEQGQLYNEFHLDEPWDSEHNKKLIPRMPKTYNSPAFPKLLTEGKASYLLPVGKDTMHPGTKGMRLVDITDGTSNTIMMVEADEASAVVWTKPEDIAFNPKEPFKSLGFNYGPMILAAFADGSVHAISKFVKPENLAAMVTPYGGEVIDFRESEPKEPMGTPPGAKEPEANGPIGPKLERSINNLKQLGLAFHNIADVSKGNLFPAAAITSKDGKPLLSWRVAVLPYIEQQNLYNEFHLDEPWDSEHNKKLIPRMPKIYASPASPKTAADFKTLYVVPTGKDTLNADLTKGMGIIAITDGTSNTIMIVEADDASAVVWTKPDDLPINAKDPHKGLGFHYGEAFLATFCDGSVRRISKKNEAATLRALFSPQGGEVVGVIP